MDLATGGVGATAGEFSKGTAKRAAISRCAAFALGGRKCKIALIYHNQRAVIAGPSENGISVRGTSVFQGGPTLEVLLSWHFQRASQEIAAGSAQFCIQIAAYRC